MDEPVLCSTTRPGDILLFHGGFSQNYMCVSVWWENVGRRLRITWLVVHAGRGACGLRTFSYTRESVFSASNVLLRA